MYRNGCGINQEIWGESKSILCYPQRPKVGWGSSFTPSTGLSTTPKTHHKKFPLNISSYEEFIEGVGDWVVVMLVGLFS